MITVHKVVVVISYILGGLAGLAGAWTSTTTKDCRGLRSHARQTTHLYSFFESNNNDDDNNNNNNNNESYSNNIQYHFNGNNNRNAESQLFPYSNNNRGDDLTNRPWHKDTYDSHFHFDNLSGNNNYSWLDTQRRRRRRSMLFQETDRLFDELWQDSHRVFDRMNRLMDSLIVRTTTGSSNAMRTRRGSPFSLMDDLRLPLSPFSSSYNDMLERQLEAFLAVPSRSLLMRQQKDDNQQQQISQLLHQVEQYLNQHPTCREIMGNPIQIDQVYSQSFSSCSVNGRLSQQQTQLECSVQGTNMERQGMVQLLATERGIQQLVLRVQDDDQGVYREIRVVDPSSLSSSSSNTPITGNNHNNDSSNSRRLPAEIVDAEII